MARHCIDADAAPKVWRELVMRGLDLELGLTPGTGDLDDGTGWLQWYDDVKDLCDATYQGTWSDSVDSAVWSIYAKATRAWRLFNCCIDELCLNGRDTTTGWILATEWVDAEVEEIAILRDLAGNNDLYVKWWRRAYTLQSLLIRPLAPPAWGAALHKLEQMLQEFEDALDFYFSPGRELWEEQPVTAWRVGLVLGATALAGEATLDAKWEKVDDG